MKRYAVVISAIIICVLLIIWQWPWISCNIEALKLILLAIGGLLLGWRGYSAHKQADTALKSHTADNYIKAIGQLGELHGKNPNNIIGLGGVYALEKIARNNADYHSQIMEVFCRTIRGITIEVKNKIYLAVDGIIDNFTGKINPDISDAYAILGGRISPLISEIHTTKGKIDPKNMPIIEPIRTDIQAMLMVIGRRDTSFDKNGDDLYVVNLRSSFLPWAHLPGAVFEKADLREINFEHSNFNNADLRNAKFNNAILCHANFLQAKLGGAILFSADLTKAVFFQTCLREANFTDAILCHANFKLADLTGAFFHGANLYKTDFENAKLQGANLDSALNLNASQINQAIINKETILPDNIEVEFRKDLPKGFICKDI